MRAKILIGFGLGLGLGLGCGSSPGACDPDAPNTICTIAGHSLDEAYAGDNKLAIDADMYIPMDSTVAPDGTVWFIDFNNYVVRQIDDQGIVRTVVGNHQLGDSPSSDGLSVIPAMQAANNHTPSLMFSNGYLYLAAWHESRVKRVRMSDMMMEDVAGRGVRTHYDGDGAPALLAGVDLPSSVALAPNGDLVFMDQGNLVVRDIDSTGTIHTIVGKCVIEAVPCSATVLPQACPGSDKLVCGDPATDCGGSDGTNLCTQSYAGDGGPATDARLNLPFTQAADPTGRIAYNHAGDLILSDTDNNRIRKVDHATGVITTLAGNGTAGYAGDGGAATSAELNHPVDLAIADDDTVYFTDVYNHCVRKIDTSGAIATVAGQCHFTPSGAPGQFSGDGGDPLKAQLYRPYGIDLVGNKLYVSDSYNNRLRVVNLP